MKKTGSVAELAGLLGPRDPARTTHPTCAGPARTGRPSPPNHLLGWLPSGETSPVYQACQAEHAFSVSPICPLQTGIWPCPTLVLHLSRICQDHVSGDMPLPTYHIAGLPPRFRVHTPPHPPPPPPFPSARVRWHVSPATRHHARSGRYCSPRAMAAGRRYGIREKISISV